MIGQQPGFIDSKWVTVKGNKYTPLPGAPKEIVEAIKQFYQECDELMYPDGKEQGDAELEITKIENYWEVFNIGSGKASNIALSYKGKILNDEENLLKNLSLDTDDYELLKISEEIEMGEFLEVTWKQDKDRVIKKGIQVEWIKREKERLWKTVTMRGI